MSPRFSDALRAYAAEQERAAEQAAGDPTARTLALAAQVRRRRASRTGGILSGAAAAVLVGAVAVYGINRPEPPPPAQTPTPSPTQTPTPTPEPERSPEPEVEPEEPTGPTASHPLLVPALPLEADTFARTDEDWVLAEYQAGVDGPDGSAQVSPVALYLLAPDGTRYEVPLPDIMRVDEGEEHDGGLPQLMDWLPGTSKAVVSNVTDGDGRWGGVVVDLATGEAGAVRSGERRLLADGGTLDVEWVEAGELVTVRAPDGAVRGTLGPFTAREYDPSGMLGSAGWALDPSRRYVAFDTVLGMSVHDLSRGVREVNLPAMPAGTEAGTCRILGWYRSSGLLVRCDDPTVDRDGSISVPQGVHHVPLDGAAPTRLTEYATDRGLLHNVVVLGDRVLVGRRLPDGCHALQELREPGVEVPVDGLADVVVSGRVLGQPYGWSGGCAEYREGLLDLTTGEVRPLLPQADGATWARTRPMLPPSGWMAY